MIACTERAVCRVCVLSLRTRAHAGVVRAGATRAGASKVMRAEGLDRTYAWFKDLPEDRLYRKEHRDFADYKKTK